jgi:hypothetical protein
MRFPTVAVCTLTVLLAGGVTAQASETSISGGSAPEPLNPERGVPSPIATAKGIEAIAPPEMLLEEQRFLQPAAIDSRQDYRLEPSLSSQNTQAVAEKQVEALVEATPQTHVAESPKAEALEPDNIIPQLSTADANQPASNQSPNKNSSLSSPLVAGIEGDAVLSKAEALRRDELVAQSSTTNANQLIADAVPASGATCGSQRVENPEPVGGSATYQLAQATITPRRCPRPEAIPRLVVPEPVEEFGASPALSIYIPVGYGADRNTVFLSGSYQASVREDDGSVGAAGIGIGLGDAAKAVGVELSYALETTDDSFGEGGFNAKLHRRLGQDLSGALGWNGFLNIGRNDFEQSKYGVITKVFRTQESLNSPFSRVAFTAGVGDGQFRSNGAVDAGDNNINVFGNVAIRVVRPISFIAEWTGQDLALGLSIAPFKKFPFVITPAVRDLAGAGDGARFVLGAGTALRF